MKQFACLAVILMLFTSCQVQTNDHQKQGEPVNSTPSEARDGFQLESESNDSAKIEISMEQAIAIAMEEANKLYSGLKLVEVHSYDNDRSRSIDAGVDGKRHWWYVDLGNEAFHYVSVLIEDGEIASIHSFDEEWHDGWFDLSQVRITSEEAVNKAMEVGLCGGDPENEEREWVSGFHFKLEYGALAESPDQKILFLDVIGVSDSRNFARVSFDAMTGDLLLAMEKLEYERGETEWRSFAND